MLAKKSEAKGTGNDYVPLQIRFRNDSYERPSFCERQEFSIKFTCMMLFAISLILFGSLISEILRQKNNVGDN